MWTDEFGSEMHGWSNRLEVLAIPDYKKTKQYHSISTLMGNISEWPQHSRVE